MVNKNFASGMAAKTSTFCVSVYRNRETPNLWMLDDFGILIHAYISE